MNVAPSPTDKPAAINPWCRLAIFANTSPTPVPGYSDGLQSLEKLEDLFDISFCEDFARVFGPKKIVAIFRKPRR